MLGTKNSILGIDIGSSNIKIVHLKQNQKWQLINWALTKTPENVMVNSRITDKNKLALTLKDILSQNNLKEKKAVTAVSNHRIITRYLTMPYMPLNELKEAVKWEAKNHIPIYNENMLIDIKVLRRTEDNKLKIALAGLAKNTSSEYLDMLLEAGLDPIAIDIYPAALDRCFSNLGVGEPYCIIDIGASLTKLVIINDGSIYADNIIHFGIQNLQENNIEYLDHSSPVLSELIDEINRFFQFFSSQNRGENVKNLVLTGGGALWKGLGDFITREIGIPSAPEFGLSNIDIDFKVLNFRKEHLHLFSNAIGLAMRGVVI